MSTGESLSYGMYYIPLVMLDLFSKTKFLSYGLWKVSKSRFAVESDFFVSFNFFDRESEIISIDELGL